MNLNYNSYHHIQQNQTQPIYQFDNPQATLHRQNINNRMISQIDYGSTAPHAGSNTNSAQKNGKPTS